VDRLFSESPGWQALLRFGAIIEEWPEPGALSSLHALAGVSLVHFLFIDNIYFLHGPVCDRYQ
jgi:hypothetical protein